MQRLAVGELNIGHLRLRDRLQVLLVDRRAEVGGQDLFDDILANLLGEAGADQRVGHFAGAEAGNAGQLLIALGDFAELLRDFIGGNVDGDFAGALGVQRGRMVMVIVAGVVVASVIVIVMRREFGVAHGGDIGIWIGFESFG